MALSIITDFASTFQTFQFCLISLLAPTFTSVGFLRWLLQFLGFPDMPCYKNAKESMPLCAIISASKIRGRAVGCTLVPLYLVLAGWGGGRGDACRIFHTSICSLKTHKSLFVACREGTCPGPGDSDRMPWPGLCDSWTDARVCKRWSCWLWKRKV